MIKEGYHSKAKDWGNYTVKKVARLKQPVECYSKDKGKALFNPVIVKMEWDIPPSEDKNEIWFPYWITWSDISDKERYGQYAPMMGEKALLELLGDAIKQDFFSDSFLVELNKAISNKLQ
ncbi:MAG: hypothetical protein ACTSW1_00340 [Candidatus Hodarchaeales archaeon]